jgi:hypothetical protein
VSRILPGALLVLLGACSAAPRPAASAPAAQSPLPLAELPPQTLPDGRCALFLWERTDGPGRRILMATAAPGLVRIVWRGVSTDLPQTAASGEPLLGLSPKASYGDARLSIDLDLDFAGGTPLAGGHVVREGSLAFTPAGGDSVVVGVAGLIGCG